MLQKIKEFSDKSQNIYRNLITGQEGTISQIGKSVFPSERHEKRHKRAIPKVKSNRATTKGRNIFYQVVNIIIGRKLRSRNVRDENGEIIGTREAVKNITTPFIKPNGKKKTIKHVQETATAIQRKLALLDIYDKIEENKIKWHNEHPEYKRKSS